MIPFMIADPYPGWHLGVEQAASEQQHVNFSGGFVVENHG